MTMFMFLLAPVLLLNPAPVDIYRCVGANGVIQFSDEPCGGPNSQVLKGVEDSAAETDMNVVMNDSGAFRARSTGWSLQHPL